jgi:hypothetical protein
MDQYRITLLVDPLCAVKMTFSPTGLTDTTWLAEVLVGLCRISGAHTGRGERDLLTLDVDGRGKRDLLGEYGGEHATT